jgi:hypothetical protein
MSTELQIFSRSDGYDWDVTHAGRIVAGREPTPVEVADWAEQLPSVGINDDHWPTADLAKPLIVIPDPAVADRLQLIDGWHRVRRAVAEGIVVLPAHVLSHDEERAIRRYEPDERT